MYFIPRAYRRQCFLTYSHPEASAHSLVLNSNAFRTSDMKNPPRYDTVLKDLFQKDRPTLLSQLAGDARVMEFLDTELAVVERRTVDLLVLLSNGKVLHIEFQSNNHRDMPYREGIYGLMIGQKLRKQISQVVIYL